MCPLAGLISKAKRVPQFHGSHSTSLRGPVSKQRRVATRLRTGGRPPPTVRWPAPRPTWPVSRSARPPARSACGGYTRRCPDAHQRQSASSICWNILVLASNSCRSAWLQSPARRPSPSQALHPAQVRRRAAEYRALSGSGTRCGASSSSPVPPRLGGKVANSQVFHASLLAFTDYMV